MWSVITAEEGKTQHKQGVGTVVFNAGRYLYNTLDQTAFGNVRTAENTRGESRAGETNGDV